MGEKIAKEEFMVPKEHLHMRPCSDVAKIVNSAGVTAIMHCNGKTANMSSVLDLLSIGVPAGTPVLIQVLNGVDSQTEQVLQQIKSVLERTTMA